jgi:hypothetical protein
MRVNEMTKAVFLAIADISHLWEVLGALRYRYIIQLLAVRLRYEPVVLGVKYQNSRVDFQYAFFFVNYTKQLILGMLKTAKN